MVPSALCITNAMVQSALWNGAKRTVELYKEHCGIVHSAYPTVFALTHLKAIAIQIGTVKYYVIIDF